MLRTYSLKKQDLVECHSISHINIVSVEGGTLYYGNRVVTEIILEANLIKDLYVTTDIESEVSVVLSYTQSYDGDNFSKENSTVTFKFPEVNTTCNNTSSTLKDIYVAYLNSEVDLPSIYAKLIKEGNCDKVFYVTPIYTKGTVPDKYKHYQKSLTVEYIGESKIYKEFTGGSLVSYKNEVIEEDVANLYLVTSHNPISDSIVIKSGKITEVVEIRELFNYDYSPIIKLLTNNLK